jgi:hypothetical protein
VGILSGLSLASRAARLDAAGAGVLAPPFRQIEIWSDNSTLTKILASEILPIVADSSHPVDRGDGADGAGDREGPRDPARADHEPAADHAARRRHPAARGPAAVAVPVGQRHRAADAHR